MYFLETRNFMVKVLVMYCTSCVHTNLNYLLKKLIFINYKFFKSNNFQILYLQIIIPLYEYEYELYNDGLILTYSFFKFAILNKVKNELSINTFTWL